MGGVVTPVEEMTRDMCLHAMMFCRDRGEWTTMRVSQAIEDLASDGRYGSEFELRKRFAELRAGAPARELTRDELAQIRDEENISRTEFEAELGDLLDRYFADPNTDLDLVISILIRRALRYVTIQRRP